MIILYTVGNFLDNFCTQLMARAPVRWISCEGNLLTIREGQSEIVDDADALADYVAGGSVFCVWNGLLPWYQSAVRLARCLGMPICFMESGQISGYLQMDPDGVNAASSIMGITPEFIRAQPIAADIWDTTFHQRAEESESRRAPIPGDTEPLPAQYLFFPCQLDHDTQLIYHSPHFKTMAQTIGHIVKDLLPGHRLVAKEHPSMFKDDYYPELMKQFPEVVWTRTRDLNELIDNALLTITINSSVGVQVLARRQRLVVLGNAIYNLPCLHAYSTSANALRGSWLTYIRDRWLVPWDFDAMLARIMDIAAGRRPWLE